jgi:hypothetical protein
MFFRDLLKKSNLLLQFPEYSLKLIDSGVLLNPGVLLDLGGLIDLGGSS